MSGGSETRINVKSSWDMMGVFTGRLGSVIFHTVRLEPDIENVISFSVTGDTNSNGLA